MNLWRLEILRLIRTHRIWILLGVFASFGALGPMTTRFLPEIIDAVGGGVEIATPLPSPELAMAGYLGNALQIGLLAVAFVSAAALAFDAKPEMAVFLRTRAPVRQILTPRYAVNMGASVLSFFIGTAIAYGMSAVLIEAPRLGGTISATVLLGVYLVFAVAVTGLAASFVRSVPGAALISVAAMIVIGLMGLIPQVAPWLPSSLVGGFDVLIGGGEFDYWGSLVVTLAASAACVSASFALMGRREV